MNNATEYEAALAHQDFSIKEGDKVSLIDGVSAVTRFVPGSKRYGIVKRIRFIKESGDRVEGNEWVPGTSLKDGTAVRVIHSLIDEGKLS